MHTECHHNQCTDYKSFAKSNISHQFKSLINSLTMGYLPILSIVALRFGGAKFLFGGGRRPWLSLSCGLAPKQSSPLQISGYATGLMESARAGRVQIRVPQAPADVRHDGVEQFFESNTQQRCKVCQKNTRIMGIKCNSRLHRSKATVC